MDNEWELWRKHILKEIHELRQDVGSMKTSIEVLKLKSGLWGFVAGAIPVIGLVLLYVVRDSIFPR